MAPAARAAQTAVVSGREPLRGGAAAVGPVSGWGDLPGREGLEPARALEAIFALRTRIWLRCMPGRETLAWPDPDGDWVLKRFLGDEPREAWWDLLHLRRPHSPGRREAQNLLGLAQDGFAVPRAVGWWEERNPGGGWTVGRFGRSALVMERVRHREHLRALLQREPAAARAWSRAVAELAAGLHARGWYHRDLYLQHLIPDGERLVLIDVGRARRQRRPRRRWFAKDLAALQHSAPDSVGARARLRVFALYCRTLALSGRGARRALLRDVLARARRMAARPPRHVDPYEGART